MFRGSPVLVIKLHLLDDVWVFEQPQQDLLREIRGLEGLDLCKGKMGKERISRFVRWRFTPSMICQRQPKMVTKGAMETQEERGNSPVQVVQVWLSFIREAASHGKICALHPSTSLSRLKKWELK